MSKLAGRGRYATETYPTARAPTSGSPLRLLGSTDITGDNSGGGDSEVPLTGSIEHTGVAGDLVWLSFTGTMTLSGLDEVAAGGGASGSVFTNAGELRVVDATASAGMSLAEGETSPFDDLAFQIGYTVPYILQEDGPIVFSMTIQSPAAASVSGIGPVARLFLWGE